MAGQQDSAHAAARLSAHKRVCAERACLDALHSARAKGGFETRPYGDAGGGVREDRLMDALGDRATLGLV